MIKQQLIPEDLLQKSNKILFVAHLAIGDFTYLQNYFQAFSKKYPHIKIDLWVDEVRRSRCFWRWNNLKKYSLYDWLENCSLFNKVYKETYSPATLKKSLQTARSENYPIVVSLAILRAHKYARMARNISPKGFVFAMSKKTTMFQIFKRNAYKKLNATIDSCTRIPGLLITDVYASWFERLFNINVAQEDRAPFVNIPKQWILCAKLCFLKWGLYSRKKQFGQVFFINPFAKDKKRCWPLKKVLVFLTSLKKDDLWNDVTLILNVPPEKFATTQKFFQKHGLNNLILFTANKNFFQLPAIISLCDLVISVETAVIHLASALKIPTIALMRQKNPEWVPWRMDISHLVTCKTRKDWIKNIDPEIVMSETKEFCSKVFSSKNS